MIKEYLTRKVNDLPAFLYVVVNGSTHSVVVAQDVPADLQASNEEGCRAWERKTLSAAEARILKHGVAPGTLSIGGIYDPDQTLDDLAELGVSDEMVITAAKSLYNDDDLTVDDNAEISGLNIQIWQYMDVEQVLISLYEDGPVPNQRTTLSMVDQAISDAGGRRLTAREICQKLGVEIDPAAGNVDEIAFEKVRNRFGEDWMTSVIHGDTYDGLLDYAQDHLECSDDDEPEGMTP